MSVHTRTRRTSKGSRVTSRRHPSSSVRRRRKSIPWREVAKENIEKYTETGLAVRGGRLRAGMTQKELADAVGAQPHHICEMEYGKRSIGKEMAHRLAKVLNMSYRMFL